MGPKRAAEMNMFTGIYHEADGGYRLEKARREMGAGTRQAAPRPLRVTYASRVRRPGPGARPRPGASQLQSRWAVHSGGTLMKVGVNLMLENAAFQWGASHKEAPTGKEGHRRLALVARPGRCRALLRAPPASAECARRLRAWPRARVDCAFLLS